MGMNGGARPGAGRKPKADKHAGAINRAEKQIKDRLPEVIDALFELALGVTVQDTDENTGATNVYTRPPDVKAATYLVDRIMGKPAQKNEITGANGEALTIKVVYEDIGQPD